MEHSYSRDLRPNDENSKMSTKTLMINRPPQCPLCHTHPLDERIDLDELHNPGLTSYNEGSAREAMEECEHVAKAIPNMNSDDKEWEEKILKLGWTIQQIKLFNKISKLLEIHQLARLANTNKQHEPIHRRVIIDKSVQRLRQALASVSWDTKLVQWIHSLLLDNLPSSYLGNYLDILQTLRAKVPTLAEKMLSSRLLSPISELLVPVMKKPWEPIVTYKNRKLPGSTYIVVVPSAPTVGAPSHRIQKWYSLFATMASVVPIQVPATSNLQKQSLDSVTEQMVAIARAKIQDSRHDSPGRHIILVGFGAGAALALQVALVENVDSVIAIGFACNTVNGIRGAADDDILDITTPVLFAIGQNSARSSQEEIEALREKMAAQTSLVVVGSADDNLRVSKTKRRIEGVTQSMVDNMVMDEIAEFAKNCILQPPKPRNLHSHKSSPSSVSVIHINRKRKNLDGDYESSKSKIPKPVGRPKSRHLNPKIKKKDHLNPNNLLKPSNEALSMAIQSILPGDDDYDDDDDFNKSVTSYDISPDNSLTKTEIRQTVTNKISTVLPISQRGFGQTSNSSQVKLLPPNQFIHLKPSSSANPKLVTLKTTAATVSGGSSTKPATQQYYTINNSPKLFTVKSSATGTTNFTSSSNTVAYSPTKYTILKACPSNQIVKTDSSLSETDIFDMPIVFADNEGNIQNNASSIASDKSMVEVVSATDKSASDATTSSATATATTALSVQKKPQQVIIQPMRKVIGDNTTEPNKNKVVLIKSSLKPGTNIIAKNALGNLKYTKVVLNNSAIAKQFMQDSQNLAGKKTVTISAAASQNLSQLVKGNKIEILNNSMIRQANTSTGTAVSTSKFQPIIINVDSDKTSLKNVIRICTTGTTINSAGKIITTTANSGVSLIPNPANTIVIKPQNFKQISGLQKNFLNRTVTVRKIVNLGQATQQKTTFLPITGATKIETTTTTTAATVTTNTTASEGKPSTSTTPAAAPADPNVD